MVAAVAALAALAVVLVQTVVSDTSEPISASEPRRIAAQVMAAEIEQEARRADPADERFDTASEWAAHFTRKCERIKITFSDAAINSITATFAPDPALDYADPAKTTATCVVG